VLPQLQPEVIRREEAELKRIREAAQHAGGEKASESDSGKRAPRTTSDGPGRNDVVTITNGTAEQSLKYKKAEQLLSEGWKLK